MSTKRETIRVACGQGFWGDLLDAPVRQVSEGPIDYLMLDYLAEVTMSIMQKQRARDPRAGYARDFIPLMREILPLCVERDIRVTANAGGVNPTGCAEAVRDVARELGLAGRLKIGTVTGDDIMHIVSKWTGVPLNRMQQKETQRLLKMEEELKQQVIGQDEAVIAISRALRRSRADLKDPRRPIGSFIFLGPTGVGKTFLARSLAEFMFGDAEALIQIDMSEYMEKFTGSRLIGSPPGYVGYEEGGQLSEAVRRRPYSVVLFDEIEKAHPDVMHLLLQILEEGKITDSLGRKIDFRNTIIIMTSNVGAELIKRQTAMGFGAIAGHGSYEAMRDKILDESKRVFKPEFLNRLDDMIVFHQLERNDLVKIVDLEVAKVIKRVRARDIKVHLDTTAVEFLIDKGYDPIYGARPMRRAVEKYLEDPLAEEFLRGNIKQGDTLEVHAAGEQLAFKVAQPEQGEPANGSPLRSRG